MVKIQVILLSGLLFQMPLGLLNAFLSMPFVMLVLSGFVCSIKSYYSSFIAFSLQHPRSFMRNSIHFFNTRYLKKANKLDVRTIKRGLKYLKAQVFCSYLQQNTIYDNSNNRVLRVMNLSSQMNLSLWRCWSLTYYISLDHLTFVNTFTSISSFFYGG